MKILRNQNFSNERGQCLDPSRIRCPVTNFTSPHRNDNETIWQFLTTELDKWMWRNVTILPLYANASRTAMKQKQTAPHRNLLNFCTYRNVKEWPLTVISWDTSRSHDGYECFSKWTQLLAVSLKPVSSLRMLSASYTRCVIRTDISKTAGVWTTLLMAHT
jgi:hypothetical protein